MKLHKVYSSWQRTREVPQIKLQGRWLTAAGIQIGAPIRVQFENGRLVITPHSAAA